MSGAPNINYNPNMRYMLGRRLITSATSWTVPANGYISLFALGGGGGGAGASTGLTYNRVLASGGGAGEIAFDFDVPVTTGEVFTFTIGARGSGGSGSYTSYANGTDGGHTIVQSSLGYELEARGGQKGVYYVAISVNGTALGGAGGSGGSGGSNKCIRFAGGSGATLTSTGNLVRATGGGGVNFFGTNNTNAEIQNVGLYQRGGSTTGNTTNYFGGPKNARSEIEKAIRMHYWDIDVYGASGENISTSGASADTSAAIPEPGGGWGGVRHTGISYVTDNTTTLSNGTSTPLELFGGGRSGLFSGGIWHTGDTGYGGGGGGCVNFYEDGTGFVWGVANGSSGGTGLVCLVYFAR